MNFMVISLPMRCMLNSSFPSVSRLNPLLISRLGLPCLEAEATAAVARHTRLLDRTLIVAVALHQQTKVVVLTFPLRILLRLSLHIRFLANWATLHYGAIRGMTQPLYLRLNTACMHSTPLRDCPLTTTSIPTLGRHITSLVISRTSISPLRTTPVRIKFV